MNPTKILVFAGSIRAGALSVKLAAAAAKEIALVDAEVTTISLADYPLPIYDGDIEAEKGVPDNAVKLARLIVAHQGVFVSTPEYNHSLPPLLTNTLAWISRIKHTGTMPYRHKVYGMGGSSDGRFGGARAIVEASPCPGIVARRDRHTVAGRSADGAACVRRIGRDCR